MTYINKPILPSLGFVQASAITNSSFSNVVMDIDNGMGTTVSNGKTDLKASSVVIMTLSRDNDGLSYRYGTYFSDATLSDKRYLGCVKSENTNFFQGSEFSFGYSDNIKPTTNAEGGTGNIVFNNYSHTKIWRLSI